MPGGNQKIIKLINKKTRYRISQQADRSNEQEKIMTRQYNILKTNILDRIKKLKYC